MKYIKAKRQYINYPYHSFYAENSGKMMNIAANFINVAKEDLDKYKNINLVCRGSSGAFISSIFYMMLKKKFHSKDIRIAYIRKEGEESHDVGSLSYHQENVLWLFIDDIICEGDTLEASFNTIKKHSKYFEKFDWVVCDNLEFIKGAMVAEKCCHNLLTTSQVSLD
jgi:hypothetical protein